MLKQLIKYKRSYKYNKIKKQQERYFYKINK